MTDITFTPATSDGVDRLGELLFETGIELFEYIFEGRDNAVAHLERNWRAESGLFSHRYGSFAFFDGRFAGLEHGFAVSEHDAAYQETIKLGVQFYDQKTLYGIASRAAKTDPMMPSPPADSYYLQHLVTEPSVRGSGAGKALLHRAFDRAAAAGHKSVQLDVLTSNPARAFYLANGMREVTETYIPELVRAIDLPGCIRMVKEL